MYAFYRDKDGEPLTARRKLSGKPEYNKTLELYQWSNKVVKTLTRRKWKVRGGYEDRQVHMVVTPTVLVRMEYTIQ